jgi:hypothetical protein
MKRHNLQLTITGPGASPENVPLSLLAVVLSRFEKAVLETLRHTRGEMSADDHSLGLVDVQVGSDTLILSVPDVASDSLALITRSVASNEWGRLPPSAHAELFELAKVVTTQDWSLQFSAAPSMGVVSACLGARNPIPAPTEPKLIKGPTVLYGRCMRVGGATRPRAEIRLHDERLLNADLTEDVAKELAQRLYEEVGLEGVAGWNTTTWKVESFRIQAVTPYRKTPILEAFASLAKAAGGALDDVDAAAYVAALRSED